MSVPNRRDSVPDPTDPEGSEGTRRGNPGSAFDERAGGVIEAATTRATTVSHRFGGVRYALKRDPAMDAKEPGTEEAPGSDSGDQPQERRADEQRDEG